MLIQRQGAHGMFRRLIDTRTAIRIEPMSKFPLVRDLTVDRQFMFESLKRVKAWIPIDGSYQSRRRKSPRVSPEVSGKKLTTLNCITVRELPGGCRR